MTGNQAIVLGAQRAGCDFFATCPTTVTRPILEGFRRAFRSPPLDGTGHGKHRQAAEAVDAPGAVRDCLDAATAGDKAMAATAGPALSACGPILGLAQLDEIPIVVVHCQHLGPEWHRRRACEPADEVVEAGDSDAIVTGDSDVALARHLTPGSIPLPVLAATDAASAYRLTYLAFDIAGRLRTPVLLLTSKDIALTPQVVDLDGIELPSVAGGVSPVSPPPRRRCHRGPGTASQVDRASRVDAASGGDAASQVDAAATKNQARLAARLTHLCDKIAKNRDLLEVVEPDPDPDAETLLISYGLADQAAREAVAMVRDAGARVSHLTIHSLWPMPEQAIRRATTPYVRRVLVPELNVGLYADELSKLVKSVKIESILRYDGGVIDPQTIARRVTDWPCG